MRDFDRLITRWRQFGGMRLIWEYARMGVLWVGVKEIVRCALHGRSFKTVYPVITELVDKELVNKYETELKLLRNASNARYDNENENVNHNLNDNENVNHNLNLNENDNEDDNEDDNLELLNFQTLEHPVGPFVWFCWLQGMEEAPELVRVCLESIRRNVTERVVVLDDRNYREYVTLPDYIEEKYRSGVIPGAMFSDMLRLELLIKYGGTWIDSTVWASPEVKAKDSKCWQAWQKIRESEFFIYRYFNRDGRMLGTSNWFIHAKAGNRLLMDVRDMLFAYWRDYNCVVEYYIFHLFFSVASKRYHEMMERMPRGNSFHALLLRDSINRPFDAEWWGKLTANVPFHKLNYRKVPKNKDGTYYEYVVNGNI